jgi:uncharacterized membrane protein YhaH (DUF805 family)
VEILLRTVLISALALLFVLVPAVAHLLEDWYAYWGQGFLALLFGVLLVYLRTQYYWEEN